MTEQKQRETVATRPTKGVMWHHYFGLPCATCRKPIAVFRTMGRQPPELVGANTSIQATCPHCKARGLYAMSELVVFKQD